VKEKIALGDWSKQKLNRLLAESSIIDDAGERIVFLSKEFLGFPYEASTLIGDSITPERLVINLTAFDCFTFLDCIEAMRLSRSYEDFRDNLVRIRYKECKITYENRNHFFTDWLFYNTKFVQDRTETIGGKKTRKITKILNRTDDSSSFLAGIKPFKRTISFIPAVQIDESILLRFKRGDYAGIYTDQTGLDVSHVGIIVSDGLVPYLRHASSAAGKVIEEDFIGYIAGKSGIIILRPH